MAQPFSSNHPSVNEDVYMVFTNSDDDGESQYEPTPPKKIVLKSVHWASGHHETPTGQPKTLKERITRVQVNPEEAYMAMDMDGDPEDNEEEDKDEDEDEEDDSEDGSLVADNAKEESIESVLKTADEALKDPNTRQKVGDLYKKKKRFGGGDLHYNVSDWNLILLVNVLIAAGFKDFREAIAKLAIQQEALMTEDLRRALAVKVRREQADHLVVVKNPLFPSAAFDVLDPRTIPGKNQPQSHVENLTDILHGMTVKDPTKEENK
ncbi:hypothetical protein HYALB_00012277 [Hymenoscyphus albidus]|uniref:Uncharacterized protein n=1 Tax=Hymenoscyphus albidus TaxID=595503 RepID=A0A9N9LQ13_9HELO|nr:hypothetical protein HYALB_00012277 [Hymenoscyphus albidus]